MLRGLHGDKSTMDKVMAWGRQAIILHNIGSDTCRLMAPLTTMR